MALLKFNNIGIRAIAAAVPRNVVKTRSLTEYYSEEDIEKFIAATGVEERRFAGTDVCASDLCYLLPNSSILMNAIGAGFAYGTVLLNIADCKILEKTEL